MKKVTITLLFISTLFLGLGQQSSLTLDWGGVTRDYIRYTPVGFDSINENLPLVIVLHGLGGNNTQMTNTGFNQIADTARFHVAYPLGKTNSFGQNSWNNGTMLSSTVNDVNFISKLIDTENQEIGIDLSRVYVCGISMGGIMTFRLAIQLNDRIAACASMVGTMSTPDINNTIAIDPMPFMQWHGTNDGTVPYSGTPRPSLELVQPTMDFWKDKNKCSMSDSTIYNLPDVMSDGATVERVVYHATGAICDTAELEHWKFTGGTHTWFNGIQNDVDGAIEFWHFFRGKTKSNPPAAGAIELPSLQFSMYPNPTSDFINITTEDNIDRVVIYDVMGKTVYENGFNSNSIRIQPNLSKGAYTVAVYANNKFHSEPIIIK